MTIDEAIQLLNNLASEPPAYFAPDVKDAVKLGREALKWRREILKVLEKCRGSETSLMGDRAYWLSKEDLQTLFALLPGETKE